MRRPLRRTDVLPLLQVACGACLLWPGPARWRLGVPVTAASAGLVAAGGVLAEEGARFLGGDLSPFVDPKPGSSLRTSGPYEISRNPIYAGLLAAATGLALLRRRPEPLAAAALLAVVLHVKTGIEEERLRDRFGAEYDAYARRTPRLLGLPSVRTV